MTAWNPAEADVCQVCLFRTAGLRLGIETRVVLEILAPRAFTAVPRAPDDVRGLLNLRGTLVPVIDLGARFGAVPAATAESFHLVIDHSLGPTSLLVEGVDDVIDVDAQALEPPPTTLDATTLPLTRAMARLDRGLLLFLDPETAGAVDEAGTARGSSGAPSPEPGRDPGTAKETT